MDRRNQILKTAIEMIADEGYAGLSMRALARASNIKLGALQYHFRTTDEMLRAVVGFIGDAYASSFRARDQHLESQSILQLIDFILNDEPGVDLMGDKLWPQLWAMQQVEPLVSDLVEDIYERYIQTLEQALRAAGNDAPRAEALCLMSMLEGATIFMGRGRRWESDLPEVRTALMHFFESRYGET
jgi:AcrR family transcriptional regulator